MQPCSTSWLCSLSWHPLLGCAWLVDRLVLSTYFQVVEGWLGGCPSYNSMRYLVCVTVFLKLIGCCSYPFWYAVYVRMVLEITSLLEIANDWLFLNVIRYWFCCSVICSNQYRTVPYSAVLYSTVMLLYVNHDVSDVPYSEDTVMSVLQKWLIHTTVLYRVRFGLFVCVCVLVVHIVIIVSVSVITVAESSPSSSPSFLFVFCCCCWSSSIISVPLDRPTHATKNRSTTTTTTRSSRHSYPIIRPMSLGWNRHEGRGKDCVCVCVCDCAYVCMYVCACVFLFVFSTSVLLWWYFSVGEVVSRWVITQLWR